MSTGLFFLIHFTVVVNNPAVEIKTVLIVSTLGLFLDYLQFKFDMFSFVSTAMPVWLVGMWLGFSATLLHSLAWLWPKPLYAIIFGFIGGPLTYFVGERFGILYFSNPKWIYLMIMGFVWALLLFGISRRLKKD